MCERHSYGRRKHTNWHGAATITQAGVAHGWGAQRFIRDTTLMHQLWV